MKNSEMISIIIKKHLDFINFALTKFNLLILNIIGLVFLNHILQNILRF